MKFRKKPVVIEAVQWNGENVDEIIAFLGEKANTASRFYDGSLAFAIETLEGQMVASVNDWLIKGIKGEFYPCKPDIFEASYEVVQADPPGIKRGYNVD